MRSFTITNADNTKMTVDLIRYFKFKTDCFLIYSIGEVDEKNYKKLYLVRIMEELGFPVVQTIKNEADWSNMQGIVKKVLKELKKNNKKVTEDLDYKEIEGIKIVDPRFFKLDSKLVDILASNYMEGESISMNNELTNMNQPISDNNGVTDSLNTTLTEEQNNNVIPSVEPLPVYSNDNIENIVDNSLVNNVESSIANDQSLESIDQTIMNQGEFKPIELDNKQNNNDSNVIDNTNASVQPIIPEQTITPEQAIVSDITLNPNIESIDVNQVKQQVEEPNNVNNSENETQNTEVDYKELYEAVKADNEATNNLLNDVINQLSAYKQKYGELE